MCRCGAAGYSVSMLSVKPELEQAFNQLCSDVVLHIRVVIAVHLREVADISSAVSYTHLDVYKRQAISGGGLPLTRSFCLALY